MNQYDSEKNKMSNEPDIDYLQSELSDILEDAGRNLRRRDDFDDVRYCRWEGQSDDGRKHEEYLGHRPTPWENASDIQIRLADRLINEHIHLVTESFFRSNMNVTGIETSDQKRQVTGETVCRISWSKGCYQNFAEKLNYLHRKCFLVHLLSEF